MSMLRVFTAGACLALAASCLAITSARSASGSGPVAFIAEVSGRVDVARAGSKHAERGTIGLALGRGDKVEVAEGGAATVLFSDGNLLELSGNSSITVGVQAKRKRGAEADPLMAEVFKSVSEGVVGGSREAGLVALAPVRGSVAPNEIILAPRQTEILDARPVFRWRAVAGADRYRVVVSGEGGELWQAESGDTSYGYPDDAPPLPRGASLLWRMQASSDRGPLQGEENGFRIKPAEESAAIRDQLERIEKGAGSAGPFLAGVYLSSQGLFLDAIARLEAVCRSRPGEPGPHEVLGQFYRTVGLMDQAAAQLQAALTLSRTR